MVQIEQAATRLGSKNAGSLRVLEDPPISIAGDLCLRSRKCLGGDLFTGL